MPWHEAEKDLYPYNTSLDYVEFHWVDALITWHLPSQNFR